MASRFGNTIKWDRSLLRSSGEKVSMSGIVVELIPLDPLDGCPGTFDTFCLLFPLDDGKGDDESDEEV